MSLKNKKDVGAPFENAKELIVVTYDFAEDGGAISDLDILEAIDDLVITDFYAKVETAVLSDGAAVIDVGIGDGGTEFWSDKGKAALAIGAVVGMDTIGPVKLASGSKIVMGIEAAALTAGKVHFVFEVARF